MSRRAAEHFAGRVLGGAVADALGALVEFMCRGRMWFRETCWPVSRRSHDGIKN